MNFLNMAGKTFLVMGVANKKSVAFQISQGLKNEGADVIYTVQSEALEGPVRKLVGADSEIHVCDVERDSDILELAAKIASRRTMLHGLVHSIAYADYGEGTKPFHQTSRHEFLQTIDISCYSLISVSNALRELMDKDASVLTISISTTEMTAESYGWMAPAKAALNSSICFLAKSFSQFSNIRFNAVCPGLLKTASSAGIPGYLDNYLFAEQCTLRRRALNTSEVANVSLFLLSEASSGINAQHIVVDAGMRVNYFGESIVKSTVRTLYGSSS